MRKRETELDILRVLALVAVIFTHASGVETVDSGTAWILAFLLQQLHGMCLFI